MGVVISSTTGQGGITSYIKTVIGGTEVTLTAPAIYGNTNFTRWLRPEIDSNRTITFTMDGDKTVTAVFEPELPITEPELLHRWEEVDGYLKDDTLTDLALAQPLTFSAQIKLDSKTNLSKILVKPHTSYAAPWEMYAIDLGSSGDTPRFIVTDGVSGGTSAVAWDNTVHLDTDEWYHLVGTYDESSIKLYLNGALIATAAVNFQIGINDMPFCIGGYQDANMFNGMISDVRIYNAALSALQVDQLYHNPYTLTASATTYGTVDWTPRKDNYIFGELVTLTAVPEAGYSFVGWTGDASVGTSNPFTITMNSNKTVAATFAPIVVPTYTLTVTASTGTVIKSPNKATYTQGETVTLSATANTGYTFGSWSGSATGTTNPVTITMNGNKSITANYTPNNSPVAHWLFDEPYQSTAIDIISGQTANLINDPNWGEAWAREHLIRLDTGSQAMQIPMSNCRPESGSIALRIQPENTDSIQILFGHALDSMDNRIALYLAAGNLALGIGDTLQNNICRLTTDQSYHVAVTWDDTAYAVFVDGDPKISGVFNGLSRLDATADVGNYGTPENRSSGIGFRGLVEDVQLYSYALTEEAIQTLSLTHYVRENRPLEFIVSGVDSQGNPISYTTQNLPQGAAFDTATQTFSWQPALYKSAGHYQITFTAAGQPDYVVTVSVLDTTLAEWYKSFLESVGKD